MIDLIKDEIEQEKSEEKSEEYEMDIEEGGSYEQEDEHRKRTLTKRQEHSLGELTRKFTDMIKSSTNNEIDLNRIVQTLGV